MLAASLFASLAGFLFGYDLGLIGGALGELREAFDASDAALGAVVAGAKVGSVFGAFVGGGGCGPAGGAPRWGSPPSSSSWAP